MNYKKHYDCLELIKVLNQVAKYATNMDAIKKIKETVPTFEIEQVKEELEKTDECYIIIKRYERFAFYSLSNPKKDIELASLGSVIENKNLLNIANILDQAQSLRLFIEKIEIENLKLDMYFKNVEEEKSLKQEIRRIIIDEDSISDNASKELFKIRKTINKTKQDIRNVLDRILSGKDNQYLMENIITIKDNRFVIPLKSEYKNKIKGLVHDVSASGSTIFIEPESILKLNNDIKILEKAEGEEIKRILKELSKLIKEKAENILKNYDVIIDLDVCFAKGEYAIQTNAVKPKINTDNQINLKKARHPLINKDEVVPIDLKLGYKNQALIITGPNTGGKTVALKTAGLLTLLASCGLMIMAQEGSEICIFKNILVSIGDSQSIEQSLSTFSANIKNIIEIIDKADERSLVLLDELGSGTDPEEGAALAVAIIDKLIEKGSVIITTTHYPELKAYGLKKEQAQNGSFEFDLKTLKPTYKLNIGIPGSSNAFAISKRIGLQTEVIKKAQNLVSDAKKSFEEVLENLQSKRKSIERELEEQKIKTQHLEELEKEIIIKTKKQEDEIKLKTERLKEEAEYLLDKTKEESNRLINKFKQWEKKQKEQNLQSYIQQTKKDIESTLENLLEIDKKITDQPSKKSSYKGYQQGDKVLITTLNQKGEVIECSDKKGKVLVLIGNIKSRIKQEDLQLLNKSQKIHKRSRVSKKLSDRSKSKAKLELDVRGENSEEAIKLTDEYLDNCVINGFSNIIIIHGIGTGILRKAIRNHLKTHPSVCEYRAGRFGEGEDGVTVVTLK